MTQLTTKDMTISLSLLDGFQLALASEATELPVASQRLIAFVACHRRPLQRAFVAGTLWGDKCESRAAANLRSTLWRIAEVADGILETFGGTLRVGRGVEVDFQSATAIAERVVRGGDVELPPIDIARLCAGDLLPDWYDDWLAMSRAEFRQLRLHALEVLADRMIRNGRFADAVDVALGAVRIEPLRESANRLVVTAQLANGNACEALRHYEQFVRALAMEFGLRPSESFTRLIDGLEVAE